MHTFRTLRGRSLPLGAMPLTAAEGVNFALMCRHGTAVSLVVYPLEGDEPLVEIPLDPRLHRSGDHWHIQVAGLPPSFRYGWRVDGPVGAGHRYDPRNILIDPAAPAISDGAVWGQAHEPAKTKSGKRKAERVEPTLESSAAATPQPGSGGTIQTALRTLRSVLPASPPVHSAFRATLPVPRATATQRLSLFFRRNFNWHDDLPPLTPLEDSVIYELHVRGFTCHPSSGVSEPGTFSGLVEKIPYLQELGVTAVELLPIHEFDENDCPFSNPKTGERLRNFWGYNSIAFNAPKAAYAAAGPEYGQVNEFRDMVHAFHAAGIEVILDVVFNHTGEGDDRGPTYSFRGLDNELYYLLDPKGNYLNYSGVGNTVNCNHPVVREMIISSLRYWVAEMHVDGLRFDLASIMGRDRKGNVLAEPPVIDMIAEDGVLTDTKLIAEPWDATGLYQVGRFPFGRRWSEWNGRYRDDVRRFWRGEPGMSGALATRVSGSADLYESSGRQPRHSVNFITAHDGFTLWDLVSYNEKHNLANGENNKDGSDLNFSWNCGVEGETNDPAMRALRQRQAKNFLVTLMLSQGVPMLLAGDEMLRTQRGNNNAWCQDNEVSWIDWSFAEKNAGFLRFVRQLVALRKRHPALRRRTFFHGPGPTGKLTPDILWHGVEPGHPDWSPKSRTLAFCLDGSQSDREPDRDFYVALNAAAEATTFRIPLSPTGRAWRRAIDTNLSSPDDIALPDRGSPVAVNSGYQLAPFAALVLISEATR
jgi:glycogen operon protein